MSSVVFIDTETTGLDPDDHEIWEVALITRIHSTSAEAHAAGFHWTDKEYRWLLPVDLSKADPVALDIGRFAERHPQGHSWDCHGDGHREHSVTDPLTFAMQFQVLTRSAHLVGAIPSFDEQRLAKLFKRYSLATEWHYHIIDVEAMAVGHLTAKGLVGAIQLPWKSRELSMTLGINPENYEVHTALGDARWARDLHDVIVHGR